jgi:putative transcriptional regulator
MEVLMSKRRTTQVDVTDELVASLEQAVSIVEGTMAPGRVHHVDVPEVGVQAARLRLGMTQPAFARAFGVALPTLRKWEQRARHPKDPARMLLRVIEREPDAVRRALVGEN